MYDQPIYPSTRQVTLAVVTTIMALVVMATLRWLGVPAGDFLDWLVGVAGFWWLLGITTVPWNLYFGARAVQSEIALSRKRGVLVERDDAAFVGRTARRSLLVALMLHLASATGFALLALTGLTSVGWLAAVAALALTVFRPTVRLYQHVAQSLRAIGRRVHYPRDDVRTALERLEEQDIRLGSVEFELNPAKQHTWARGVEQKIEELQRGVAAINRQLEQAAHNNDAAHRQLSRDIEEAVNSLGEDNQFLGNVRDIIRFVKEA